MDGRDLDWSPKGENSYVNSDEGVSVFSYKNPLVAFKVRTHTNIHLVSEI